MTCVRCSAQPCLACLCMAMPALACCCRLPLAGSSQRHMGWWAFAQPACLPSDPPTLRPMISHRALVPQALPCRHTRLTMLHSRLLSITHYSSQLLPPMLLFTPGVTLAVESILVCSISASAYVAHRTTTIFEQWTFLFLLDLSVSLSLPYPNFCSPNLPAIIPSGGCGLPGTSCFPDPFWPCPDVNTD